MTVVIGAKRRRGSLFTAIMQYVSSMICTSNAGPIVYVEFATYIFLGCRDFGRLNRRGIYAGGKAIVVGQDGFTVDIWKRIAQAGTFIQVEFTASVFRDGTPFEVRALDIRAEESEIESVYQTARPGDVDRRFRLAPNPVQLFFADDQSTSALHVCSP